MTLFLLIRHGSTDVLGQRLVGRLPGISVNPAGCAETARLAERLAPVAIEAVYSSPMERALSTASLLAIPHGLDIIVREGLTEVDFGAWSGLSFEELHEIPEFHQFNNTRVCVSPPGGEHVAQVQARMAEELRRLSSEHPDGAVMLVSHADPLRAVLGFFFGIPIDLLRRIEVAPASLSVIRWIRGETSLLSLNDTGLSCLPRKSVAR